MAKDDIKDKQIRSMVTGITDTARDEINEERIKKFTALVKSKLMALDQAKEIVKNIENEITDLEIAISGKLA